MFVSCTLKGVLVEVFTLSVEYVGVMSLWISVCDNDILHFSQHPTLTIKNVIETRQDITSAECCQGVDGVFREDKGILFSLSQWFKYDCLSGFHGL